MTGTKRQSFKKRKLPILFLHMGVGMLLFYFIIHPLAMAIYAGHGADAVTDGIGDRVLFQLKHAFSFHMLPMAYVFIGAGALVGLLSGFYWLSLAHKRLTQKEPIARITDNVRELIDGGENHFVEFKSSMRYDYRQKTTNRELEAIIAKTLAGFMNAEGGHLLIGVNDNGEVMGLEKDFITLRQKNEDGFERRFFDLVTTSLGTEFCHLCTASFHHLHDKAICVVQIEPSSEPVYLKGTETTDFYVRAGNATRPLSVKETVKYLRMKGTKRTLINEG